MVVELFRTEWWPGVAPTIKKNRIMCSACKYHSSAPAGWQWDRCSHPEADFGGVVRNEGRTTCADIRNSSAQCGVAGKWFSPMENSCASQ